METPTDHLIDYLIDYLMETPTDLYFYFYFSSDDDTQEEAGVLVGYLFGASIHELESYP